jgi:hypothetical protein
MRVDAGIGLPVPAIAEVDNAVAVDRHVDESRGATTTIDYARPDNQQIALKCHSSNQLAAAWSSCALKVAV